MSNTSKRATRKFDWLAKLREAMAAEKRAGMKPKWIDYAVAGDLSEWLDEDMTCYRAAADVGEVLGYGETAMRQSLKRLVERGFLEVSNTPKVSKKRGKIGRNAKTYVAVTPKSFRITLCENKKEAISAQRGAVISALRSANNTVEYPVEGSGAPSGASANTTTDVIYTDVVDKSDVLDLSLVDDPDATDMSGGQAFEKPSPALASGSGQGDEADQEPAPEPSFEPAPEYGTDWDDDEIEEPSDFEIAVGDLVRLIGDRDIALSLADDIVDGFAGHDHHIAMQAVKTAADCVDGLGVDFAALRDIVAEIGASAGRGASVGSEIAAKFSVELATHRRTNSGAYQEGETCHV